MNSNRYYQFTIVAYVTLIVYRIHFSRSIGDTISFEHMRHILIAHRR